MSINISTHALMRYFQRFGNVASLNEDSFKAWKRDNGNECINAEKILNGMYNDESNMIFKLVEKNEDVEYRINYTEKWILVIKNNVMLTCYAIKYNGISEETSLLILNSLVSEIKPKMAKRTEMEEALKEKLAIKENRVDDINTRIKLLRQEIELLQKHQKLIEEEYLLSELELKNYSYEVDNLIVKVVKPEKFI